MPAEELHKHVTGLTVKRLEKPKNLKDQCQKHWDEILSYQYHFSRGRRERGVMEGSPLTMQVLLSLVCR